jgi:hypothetical protein
MAVSHRLDGSARRNVRVLVVLVVAIGLGLVAIAVKVAAKVAS